MVGIPAVVLTAGLATRLRPLSLVRAKAAMPVAGRPLAWLILERLRDAGVTSAVLNLHHLPHTLTSRIGDGTALGLPVRYSWETTVLGSAGGPKRAAPLVGEPTFLVVNGDTLCSVDLDGLLARASAVGSAGDDGHHCQPRTAQVRRRGGESGRRSHRLRPAWQRDTLPTLRRRPGGRGRGVRRRAAGYAVGLDGHALPCPAGVTARRHPDLPGRRRVPRHRHAARLHPDVARAGHGRHGARRWR